MNHADAVTICECFARDGLQHEPDFIATEVKRELIMRFAALGFKRIEATSYSNPKVVPQFADASDATDALMKDPSKYVDAAGDIDTDAIEADLAALLERKPHWGKPAPAADPDPEADPTKPAKPKPKPDPGQGSRGGPAPVDFRNASQDELAAELAKYRYRQRSL